MTKNAIDTRAGAAGAARHAVYFAPRTGGEFWRAGSQWLGRCAERGEALPQPHIDGVAPQALQRLTQAPRRYGWHATLKAPFTLAEGVTPARLRGALARIAQCHAPFEMPPLKVALLDDFLALVPASPCPAVDAVAADCVTALNPLSRPLDAAQIARRRRAGLTPEEDALMLRWGYPFVLDRFRFHLSLTGSLAGTDRATVDAVREAAERWFAPLAMQPFDRLALFVEPRPEADFALQAQLPLEGVL